MERCGEKEKDKKLVITDREKAIKALEYCKETCGGTDCPYWNGSMIDGTCILKLHADTFALLKEQEPIKPIINEYGGAYCICGENVGIIPDSNYLPTIRSKYCSGCGRRMKWDD